MMVTIRVQPSKQGGKDEYVRLAEMATMSEILAELTATARHYAKVRDQHHRATACVILREGVGHCRREPGRASVRSAGVCVRSRRIE